MEWNSPEFEVTDAAPQLTFECTVLWRAQKLLRDSTGKCFAVAVAIDPIRRQELLVSGCRGVVPFCRAFVFDQSRWKMVEDEGLTFTALRVADPNT